MPIDLSDEFVRPGDVLRFEYEITTDNQTLADAAISHVKNKLHDDPQLDYQGSKVFVVGDKELRRDVKILHVYASVREYEKNSKVPVQEASIGTYMMVGAGLAATLAVALVIRSVVKETGITIQQAGVAFEKGWFGLAVLLLIVLWLLKG